LGPLPTLIFKIHFLFYKMRKLQDAFESNQIFTNFLRNVIMKPSTQPTTKERGGQAWRQQ
jgi:hypothetical protein